MIKKTKDISKHNNEKCSKRRKEWKKNHSHIVFLDMLKIANFWKKRYNLFKRTLNKTKFDKYIKLTSLSNKQYNKFTNNKWF